MSLVEAIAAWTWASRPVESGSLVGSTVDSTETRLVNALLSSANRHWHERDEWVLRWPVRPAR
jgi:hypothetical protein